jgi:hypothetical protein
VFPTLDTLPTQSLVQKWLRDEKGIYFEIEYISKYYMWEVKLAFCNDRVSNKTTFIDDRFKTYEDALERGIFEAFKLI